MKAAPSSSRTPRGRVALALEVFRSCASRESAPRASFTWRRRGTAKRSSILRPSGECFGEVVSVETYFSLLKGYLSFSYDFDLVDRAPRLKRLLAEMKRKDPLGLSRRKRRALCRRHLRRMWNRVPGAQATSPAAANSHALLVTAWQVLARGGELAPQVSRWSPECGPTRADLSFDVTRVGNRYAVLWLRPLKK